MSDGDHPVGADGLPFSEHNLEKLAWEKKAHELSLSQEREIELIKIRKEIWEKTIDTQMHFNDMSGKSRQLGISLVIAALGLAVVLLYRREDATVTFSIFGLIVSTHISGIIVMISSISILAIKQLDLEVYHKMLRGAVAFGEEIETMHLSKDVLKTEKGLTGAISHFSRHSDASLLKCGDGSHYIGSKRVNAADKIRRFYSIAFFATLILGVCLTGTFLNVKSAPSGAVQNTQTDSKNGQQSTEKSGS
ncbi:hypothetical protein [Azospirillum sp. B2RO_4]|uniref:hypothetical protein n=1 Tax=Azospirillum sp. B2RO_4 TaxID=3027796 RepID=UPI003DA9404B